MGSATNGPSPEAIQQLFDACDLDGNGYIEWEELEVVCENLDRDELEHIFEVRISFSNRICMKNTRLPFLLVYFIIQGPVLQRVDINRNLFAIDNNRNYVHKR